MSSAWSRLPLLSKIAASSEYVDSEIPLPEPISERVRESWAASVTLNDTGVGRSSRRSITAYLRWWWVGGVVEVHRVAGWSEP